MDVKREIKKRLEEKMGGLEKIDKIIDDLKVLGADVEMMDYIIYKVLGDQDIKKLYFDNI